MNHNEPYSAEYLKNILSSVKTIAMVGASPDKTKFSYGVLRVLHETGYDMIPVNPKPGIKEIRNLKVYPNLSAIDRPCLLYTSPSPRDRTRSRMPSSA